MKVFIVNGWGEYTLLMTLCGFISTDKLEEADVVLFTGGEDVSPELYGHPAHAYTYNNRKRDEEEMKVYFQAKKLGLPCVGICRGGQFLNVMSGGKMYQHVTKHAGKDHKLICHGKYETYNAIIASSTHHQMMCPTEDAMIIATANQGSVRYVVNDDMNTFRDEPCDVEYEVVYYKDKKNLCFQPHPEFMDNNLFELRTFFNDLVHDMLKGKVG